MIRAVIFDLDNTLTDFMRVKQVSIEAATDAMLDAGPDVISLDWRVDGFAFPHGAVRVPGGDVAVAETFEQAITWVPGDGSSADPLQRIADARGAHVVPP